MRLYCEEQFFRYQHKTIQTLMGCVLTLFARLYIFQMLLGDGRWGRTPLQDAVDGSHNGMVAMLRSKGGTLQESLSAMQVLDAVR